MKRVLSVILTLISCDVALAQNFLNDIRKDGSDKGHVTVNQSPAIEQIIIEPKSVQPVPEKTTSPKDTPTSEGEASTGSSTLSEPATANNPVAEQRKTTTRTYKTTGYRIQVYTGGNKRTDKEKCEEIARRLKSSIPGIPVYVHFYSPSWKCRAGNFTSLEEAQQVLSQVKAMGYTQACLVKGTINVPY